jgi:hypothetical protein
MNPSHLSFSEIIEELRRLGQNMVTGSFVIVTNENHYVTVGFEDGRIISLQYRLIFGLQAIPRFAKIEHGSCNFNTTSNFIRKIEILDNEEVIQKILSARENIVNHDPGLIQVTQQKTQEAAKTKVNNKQTLRLSIEQKEAIEDILIEELGPMGSIVMDSVVMCQDIDSLLNVVQNELGETGKARPVIQQIMDILTH